MVGDAKKNNKKLILFKVDLENAYVRLGWLGLFGRCYE
jgi:hypothetical protein